MCIRDSPITMEGKAKFMIANALAASLATYLYGFEIEDIANSLRTFIPSAQLTPGRLNVFKFKNFKVLIDFAHNPAGYEAIEDYLKNVEATKKIGIIAGVGDRRNEDIFAVSYTHLDVYKRQGGCCTKSSGQCSG